jgi:hypothetical protein
MTSHISFTRFRSSSRSIHLFWWRAQKCLIRKKEQNGDHRPANIVTFVVRAHRLFLYYWIGQQIWAHYRLNGVCIYEVTSLSLSHFYILFLVCFAPRFPLARAAPSPVVCEWEIEKCFIRILLLLLFYRHPCDVHRKSWFLKNALDPWRTSFLWSDDFLNRLGARAVNANFLCARSSRV